MTSIEQTRVLGPRISGFHFNLTSLSSGVPTLDHLQDYTLLFPDKNQV